MMRTFFNMIALLWCLALVSACDTPECECKYYIEDGVRHDLDGEDCAASPEGDNGYCYVRGWECFA